MQHAEVLRRRFIRQNNPAKRMINHKTHWVDKWSNGADTIVSNIQSFERWNYPVLNRIEENEDHRLIICLDGSTLRFNKVVRVENHHKRLYYTL